MSSEKPSLALSGTSDPSNADSNGVDSQTSSTGSLSVPYAASVEESRTALLDRHTQAEDLDGKSSRSFPTFSFYGLKAILPLYLNMFIGFDEDTSTSLVHIFIFGAYAFPLLGGWLGDSVIGKYRTILWLSILYSFGCSLLSVTAIPGVTGNPPHWWGVALSLLLIAIGTGGIKPCASSFGGDQFRKSEAHLLESFFAWWYLSINLGSIFSTFLTPVIRVHVSYSVAFAVPAILLVIATMVFWFGRNRYRHAPLTNMFGLLFSVICTACKTPPSASEFETKPSNCCQRCCMSCCNGCCDACWGSCCCSFVPKRKEGRSFLDKAVTKYSLFDIEKVKATLRCLIVFIPLPVFWSLFDQHATRWVFQAKQMYLWEFTPDQTTLLNPLFVLFITPLCEYVFYPAARRIGLSTLPLRRMWVGMIVIGGSFIMAAIVQIMIDNNPAHTVGIWWQLPQYGLLTAGEVLVSITGLEFAYSQAPVEFKGVIMSLFLLTTSIGNIFVATVAEARIFPDMKIEFFFFAGLMGVTTVLFLILTRNYRYKTFIFDEKHPHGESTSDQLYEQDIEDEYSSESDSLIRAEVDQYAHDHRRGKVDQEQGKP